jgi:hypothetical protein
MRNSSHITGIATTRPIIVPKMNPGHRLAAQPDDAADRHRKQERRKRTPRRAGRQVVVQLPRRHPHALEAQREDDAAVGQQQHEQPHDADPRRVLSIELKIWYASHDSEITTSPSGNHWSSR